MKHQIYSYILKTSDGFENFMQASGDEDVIEEAKADPDVMSVETPLGRLVWSRVN